ncbi:MAG: flippase-like domain-containing protein [Candidatus Methanofastidiosia archaeon]
MRITKNKMAKTALAFLIGFLIIFLLVRKVGFAETFNAMKEADLFYLAVALIFCGISIYLGGWRWKSILDGSENGISDKSIFVSLLSGNFVNNVTPAGRGGGEPLRAYLLSKFTGMDPGKVFATVISDRIFDTLPFVLFGFLGVIEIVFHWNVPDIVIVSLILALVILSLILGTVLYLIFNIEQGKRFVFRIIRFIARFFPDKIKKYEGRVEDTIELFNNTIKEIARDRKKVAHATILSLGIWIFWIFRTYFVFLSFGVSVSFVMLAVVVVVSSFFGMMPFSPGGFGTTEGAMIVLFSAFGVQPHIAVAVTIVDRFISYWLPSIIGAVTLELSRREIVKIKKASSG